MVKKIGPLLFLMTLTASGFASDWRADVANFFGAGTAANYQAAAAYLETSPGSFTDEDKPVACGLLAFLYGQLGDKKDEYQKLGDYFEKYGPLELGYEFLPLAAQADVVRYLRAWQLKYPWVLKIGFVESSGVTSARSSPNPPDSLVLGIEMASDVYYKLSDSQTVLKGGLFRRGFNSITVETRKFFSASGTHTYFLEFKAGDLIVRRELAIDVRRESFGVIGQPAEQGRKIPDLVLKMFLGDQLLASSRKSFPSPPMKIDIPPPGGEYDPFGPGYKNDPGIQNSFPIMALPAVIADLIKKLTKRGEVEPVPPVELRAQAAFVFREKNAVGDQVEVRARLDLGLRNITFFPFALRPSS